MIFFTDIQNVNCRKKDAGLIRPASIIQAAEKVIFVRAIDLQRLKPYRFQ